MEVFDNVENMKNCPIEVSLNILGKKWSIQIIRDLFKGKTKFTQFLESNPQLSTKMLSMRLKELQASDIIKKTTKPTTPVEINYLLTSKGKRLNKILFHLAEFSLENYSSRVYNKKSSSINKDIFNLKKWFQVID